MQVIKFFDIILVTERSFLNDKIDLVQAEAVATGVRAVGSKAISLTVDVTNVEAVDAMASTVVEQFGNLCADTVLFQKALID